MTIDLSSLAAGVAFNGRIPADARAFLHHHKRSHTAEHSHNVAAAAQRLAERFGSDATVAVTAAWLHDISAVIPNRERLGAAHAWGVPVLPEEARLPMILHQKLSVVIARDIFGVADEACLSAIGCHTTLKAGAAPLDQLLFVADKIAWDQPGTPPYLAQLTAALDQSLTAAALVYINYLWDRRERLPVVHPWLREARAALLAHG